MPDTFYAVRRANRYGRNGRYATSPLVVYSLGYWTPSARMARWFEDRADAEAFAARTPGATVVRITFAVTLAPVDAPPPTR